jgi:hypothetical protein
MVPHAWRLGQVPTASGEWPAPWSTDMKNTAHLPSGIRLAVVAARGAHGDAEEATMLKRVLTTTVFVLSAGAAISATVVGASSLTERVEARRMTILATDPAAGRFQCVEHRHWTAVVASDLRGLHPGDIVRVEPQASGRARLVLLRSAADELSSPEN